MTDLLLRPEDTGEILTGVGEHTANLAPYVAGLPPAFRRPTAVLTLIEGRGCRTIEPNDEDFVRPGQPAPVELPTPPPAPPKPAAVWDYAPVEPPRRGRHRRPSRWDWLTVPLSIAAQIIRAAL
jgi:hypothetical protein